MTEELKNESSPRQAVETVENTLESLFGSADVKSVYGRPVQQGETTIIPAAEVLAAGGFWIFYGDRSRSEESDAGRRAESAGGGGGTSQARPVAVIVASPTGVRVEPVVDLTKIGLAAITAWGFMFSQILKMRKEK